MPKSSVKFTAKSNCSKEALIYWCDKRCDCVISFTDFHKRICGGLKLTWAKKHGMPSGKSFTNPEPNGTQLIVRMNQAVYFDKKSTIYSTISRFACSKRLPNWWLTNHFRHEHCRQLKRPDHVPCHLLKLIRSERDLMWPRTPNEIHFTSSWYDCSIWNRSERILSLKRI